MNQHFFYRPVPVTVFSSLLVIVLGIIDFTTGWELGFFTFYFIPIAYSAWYAGYKLSLFTAVFSAVIWFLADYFLLRHYSSIFFLFWNMTLRLVVFFLVSFFVSKLHNLLLNEKKISNDLREAAKQIKTLKGFLPICASCKKIRNDDGYWEQLEKYICEHSDAEFSHGLCDACARRLYPELFNDTTMKDGNNS